MQSEEFPKRGWVDVKPSGEAVPVSAGGGGSQSHRYYDQYGEITPARREIMDLRQQIDRIESKLDRLLASIEAAAKKPPLQP